MHRSAFFPAAIAFLAVFGCVQSARAQSTPAAAAPAGDAMPANGWHPRSSVEVAMRIGPGFVGGEVEKNANMSDQLGVPLALAIDLGYRINEHLYVGGLWAVGFGFVRPAPCPATFRCPPPGILSDLGGVARYHLAPTPSSRIDPWIGAGLMFGVEGASATRTAYVGSDSGGVPICIFDCGGGQTITYTQSSTRYGLDGVIEGGLDYRLSRRVALGVSLSVFFGKYFSANVENKTSGSTTSDASHSTDASMHVWAFPAAHFVIDFESPPSAPPPPPTTPPSSTPPTQPPTQPTEPTQPDPNDVTL